MPIDDANIMRDFCGPIELVVLQSTPFCNLDCSYCYLSQASRRDISKLPLTSVASVFRKILSSRYLGAGLQISWHSGEPLVLKPAYYEAAINTILGIRDEYLPKSFDIRFDIQTNGTLINQEWCDFFKAHHSVLSVGVSCDGPAFLHDAHRRNWAGQATHRKVIEGIELLQLNGICFDVIAVVSEEGLENPIAFIEFFDAFNESIREFHFNLHDELSSIGFIDDGKLRAFAHRYDVFLRKLLSNYQSASSSLRIRNFSAFYEMILSESDTKPLFDAQSMSWPLKVLNIQTNGDVSTLYAGLTGSECKDLYGDGRGLIIGNLIDQDLDDLSASSKLRQIWHDFEVSHRACEATCDYYRVCSGGYNLVKYKRFGTFNATETPECRIHIKTFTDVMLNELNINANSGEEGN